MTAEEPNPPSPPTLQQMEGYALRPITNPPPKNSVLYLDGDRGSINLDSHLIQQNKFQMDFRSPESKVKIDKYLKPKMGSSRHRGRGKAFLKEESKEMNPKGRKKLDRSVHLQKLKK